MPLPSLIRFDVALAAVLLAAAPLAAAQVYKWVDEKGVVNYGNKPPPPARGAKGASVIEDRVSVYTPDPAVAQATQNARDRSALPSAGGSFTLHGQADRRASPPTAAAPAPAPSNDPCTNAGDVNCYAYPGYARRYGTPRLVQPQLPPGAIAGNVNQGNGYTPGLSTQARVIANPPTTMRPAPGGSFTLKDRDDRTSPGDRGHRSR